MQITESGDPRDRITNQHPLRGVKGETVNYTTVVTLTSFNRECPTKEEAEKLITDQMAGELTDDGRLICICVEITEVGVDGG